MTCRATVTCNIMLHYATQQFCGFQGSSCHILQAETVTLLSLLLLPRDSVLLYLTVKNTLVTPLQPLAHKGLALIISR